MIDQAAHGIVLVYKRMVLIEEGWLELACSFDVRGKELAPPVECVDL